MLCYSEQQFIRALRREPERRSIQVGYNLRLRDLSMNNVSLIQSIYFSFPGFTSDLHLFDQSRSVVKTAWIGFKSFMLYGTIWASRGQWHFILVSCSFYIAKSIQYRLEDKILWLFFDRQICKSTYNSLFKKNPQCMLVVR